MLLLDEIHVDRRSLAFGGGLAALALWSLASAAWAPLWAWPVLEAERGLVYAATAVALILVLTPARAVSLLAGVVAGTTGVAVYALSTRLFPGGRGGAYDPASGYRLAEPIGYANALGVILAMGLLLGFGFALRTRPVVRAGAGAALVPLAVALYYTFSRGAVIAVLAGVVILALVERRSAARLGLLALAPAFAVMFAARPAALTGEGYPLSSAQADGRLLAWELLTVAAVGAVVAGVTPRIEGRVLGVHRNTRTAAVVVLVVASVVGIAAALRGDAPAGTTAQPGRSLRGESAHAAGLDRRLLSASDQVRADYWRVAARMVGREPLLGEGAGAFERWWVQERQVAHDARDAHSLYLETLAELGPVGLALLLVALGAPLTAVRRTQGAPLTAAAAAAYVAFLAHSAVDWDWEVPLLVLCALVCAASLVVAGPSGRPVSITAGSRAVGVAAAVAVLGVALVAHVGNRAVAASASALERGDAEAAADAARAASTWAPWSHEPLRLLGEAELAAGDLAQARRDLRRAARLAPEEWRVWLDLALVSRGAERRYAITRARDLNPRGVEILELGHR